MLQLHVYNGYNTNRMRFNSWLIPALLCLSVTVSAQAPYIFTKFDLAPGSAPSNPDNFCISNGKLFFTATTAAAGTELWVTDGTTAGTKMVLDIDPGGTSAFDNSNHLPGFVDYNGKLYFSAFSASTGYELWVSDGTAAGTKIVKDLYPGAYGNVWYQKAVYNGKLYFSADESSVSNAGQELYVTDGTAAGTAMVKDIFPGVNPSNPMDLTVCNGKLFFTAKLAPSTSGRELWITDGTSTGTQVVKDIYPGNADAFSNTATQHALVVLGNKLLFGANDGINGEELWISDGTSTGTKMVYNLRAGGVSSNPFANNWYYVYNGKVYFWAFGVSQLWSTDGTTAGTRGTGPLNMFQPNVPPTVYNPFPIVAYKGQLIFAASDHSVPNPDEELWITDGTFAGAHQLKNICPAILAGFDGGSPYQMIVYKNMLYFQARPITIAGDYELFRSDSTAAGTVMLAPTGITAPNPFTGKGSFINYNDALYFASAWGSSTDNELWSMKDTTSSSGIEKIETPQCNIYPNPNNGSFIIETNSEFKNGSVTVYNLMGQQLYQTLITNSKFSITLNQPSGVYLVKLQLDDAVLTRRVAVE